ncbi:TetR/AcrR family transcriptional regulator [Umboniibacter marinipuniceus]|uniref:TetR family transcriptional regulator n=1 Tax=Umboniibacter marinipuniceus TaxID=569599 RepID=A0A3M0A7F6_9GAMM|nr:TetR/AcrR family transcriptional regulator [Umboniibacter marinipuniceus]RMA79469.1 TetR family transcriptional regulator [Umboniibacter marinipuniceus]
MATAKVTAKQAIRRQQILDHAAAEFNTAGYEGLSITKLAGSMGMRSSNIYYYFDSKECLLRDCYCQSLAHYAKALMDIRKTSSRYEVIINNFFSFHFNTWHAVHSKEHSALAMVYEQHLLSADAMLAVKSSFDTVQQQLDDCFEQGRLSGTLRSFSHQAAADFLHAIFDWGTIWIESIRSSDQVMHIAEISADVYLNGIATHFEPKLLSELRHLELCEQIIRRAAGHEGQFPVKDAISNAATRLFNSIGFEAASIDRVCAEVGLSKGAFYHHFKDKNAVLKYSFKQALAFDKYLYQEVTQHAKDGLDAIKLLIQLDAMAVQHRGIQLPLYRLIRKLAAEDVIDTIQEVDYIRSRFMEFVISGVHDGSIRTSASSVIAHCCFAMKQRILRFPKSLDSTTDSLLDNEWDIFFHGTLKRNA